MMPTRSAQLPLVISLSLCWFLLTFPVAIKYLGSAGWLLMIAGEAAVLGLLALVPWMRRQNRDIPWWVLPALWIALVAAYFAIYPHTQHLPPGRGTDREDALRVQILALQQHRDPYAVRTFLNQLPTPLPGAIAMAWPFYVLGRISFQNILWTGLFGFALTRIYRSRITASVFFLVILCLNLEPLNDFVSGSDYVLNAIYVGLAMWLVLQASNRDRPAWHLALWCVFFGITVSSRPSYFMTVPPVLALVLHRRGIRMCLISAVLVALAFSATIIPVFRPHPVSGLLVELNEISHRKTQFLPAALPIQTISATGMLVAFSAFFVRLDRLRLFLVTAIATAVLIGVPLFFEITAAVRQHQEFPVSSLYLFTPIFFFALWAFDRLEQLTEQRSKEEIAPA